MTYCANCGATVEGRFCAKCGTAVAGTAGAQQSFGGVPPASGETLSAPGLSDNIAGLLSYLLIPAIIFLIVEPYSRSRFVRFHAFQAIFLCVAFGVLSAALGLFFSLTVHFVGLFVFGLAPIWLLLQLLEFAIWVFLMYKAYQGEEYMLPVIGPLAAKQV